MPKTDRPRLDYMPCPAALEALEAAQALYPDASAQALLDRLVITGLSALVHEHWRPPPLLGKSRDGWRLPPGLRIPGASR